MRTGETILSQSYSIITLQIYLLKPFVPFHILPIIQPLQKELFSTRQRFESADIALTLNCRLLPQIQTRVYSSPQSASSVKHVRLCEVRVHTRAGEYLWGIEWKSQNYASLKCKRPGALDLFPIMTLCVVCISY